MAGSSGEGSIVLLLAAGVGLIVLLWVIGTMNRFVHLRNLIRESWANVDVALKRRHDLIPNLVETARAYAAHEQALFQQLAEARERAVVATGRLADFAREEASLGRALGALMARVEAYPELKASQHFMELQRELANTEDRIAAARRFYNANVRDYNTMLESFPSSLLAGSREPAEYFELGT